MTGQPQSAIRHARSPMRDSHFSLLTSHLPRPAFSLLELMIAIVILGIGMVMIATVFPIGLDMARQSLQMNISQSVVESAMATLKTKVPVYDFELTDDGYNTPYDRVVVPDVVDIEIDDTPAPCEIINEEDEVMALSFGVITGSENNWDPTWPGLSPSHQTVPEFIARTRVFTERTGWAAEKPPGSTNSSNDSAIVPSQNLLSDYMTLASSASLTDLYKDIPTIIPPAFIDRTGLPRVSLVDQVYPPVPVTEIDPGTGDTVDRPVADVLAELASRRYSWAAIHHLVLSEEDERDLLVTIAVTHRAELNARFAKQEDESKGGSFKYVLTDPDDQDHLKDPKPDDVDEDTLFPQAWLAMLESVNLHTGEVRCTSAVARLLPAGSFFVVAQSVPPANPQLFAGTAHQVSRTTYDPTDTSDEPLAVLQIGGGGGGSFDNVAIWVFPPAIRARGDPPTFDVRSPMVGVAMRSLSIE